MPYCTWPDVEAVYPEASSIVTTTPARDAMLLKASGLVDNFLSPIMPMPAQPLSGGGYDAILVDSTACLAADLAARARVKGRDDLYPEDYSGRRFTCTAYGHAGYGQLAALYDSLAALAARQTPGEVALVGMVSTLTTTNGALQARYSGGRFQGETPFRYVVTITSTGGTVAAGTLAADVVREDGEELWSEQLISDGSWLDIERGLQIRFQEALAAPTWASGDSWTLTCTPAEVQDMPSGGVSSRPVVLG